MNITGIASQPPGPVVPNIVPNIAPNGEAHVRPGAAPRSVDSIGTLLADLATPSIQSLLSAAEPHRSHGTPEVAEGLIRAAADAVAAHDLPRALRALAELIRANPESADAILREPSLQPIQGDVRALLQQIGHEAKIAAETALIGASHVAASGVPPSVLPGGLYAPDALALAYRFYEAGQLANYMRAEALGRMVIASYQEGPEEAPNRSEKAIARFKMLWRRAPMLILLIAWLLVGLAGGISTWIVRISSTITSPQPSDLAFDLWGIGFLTLVALQFFATVYNRNSRKLN